MLLKTIRVYSEHTLILSGMLIMFKFCVKANMDKFLIPKNKREREEDEEKECSECLPNIYATWLVRYYVWSVSLKNYRSGRSVSSQTRNIILTLLLAVKKRLGISLCLAMCKRDFKMQNRQ